MKAKRNVKDLDHFLQLISAYTAKSLLRINNYVAMLQSNEIQFRPVFKQVGLVLFLWIASY